MVSTSIVKHTSICCIITRSFVIASSLLLIASCDVKKDSEQHILTDTDSLLEIDYKKYANNADACLKQGEPLDFYGLGIVRPKSLKYFRIQDSYKNNYIEADSTKGIFVIKNDTLSYAEIDDKQLSNYCLFFLNSFSSYGLFHFNVIDSAGSYFIGLSGSEKADTLFFNKKYFQYISFEDLYKKAIIYAPENIISYSDKDLSTKRGYLYNVFKSESLKILRIEGQKAQVTSRKSCSPDGNKNDSDEKVWILWRDKKNLFIEAYWSCY